MQGKTHFAAGIAAGLAVCHPDTWGMLIAGIGAAAIGGVISDIDAGSSSAHRDADKVTAVIVVVLAAVIIADINLHLGIYNALVGRISQPRILTVSAVFAAVCAWGKSTRHRTFMHSICAGVILSVCLYLLFPALTPYFAAAFVSHLLLDVLNRRKVQLFWPAKKGVCIGLCNSGGWVNGVIFCAAMTASVLLFFRTAPVRAAGFALRDIGRIVTDQLHAWR